MAFLGVDWVPAIAVAHFAAAAAHLAFQAVVHVVVYPGLADQAATDPAHAGELHARYTERMARVVPVVYGVLVVTAATALAVTPGLVTAIGAGLVALVLVVTGVLAVPLHRRLSETGDQGATAAGLRRLARVDRLRVVLGVALVIQSVVAFASPRA